MFRPVPLFVGLRHTRARRRNHFISFISLISMLGIMLGIVALIVVLSVMNGFHKEIQERILGMASHATLSTPEGIEDWEALIERVREHPRVVGAAPFVENEGMRMHAGHTQAALLRGILPAREDAVSDLREDMGQGSRHGAGVHAGGSPRVRGACASPRLSAALASICALTGIVSIRNATSNASRIHVEPLSPPRRMDAPAKSSMPRVAAFVGACSRV